jgi:hypothetical protein
LLLLFVATALSQDLSATKESKLAGRTATLLSNGNSLLLGGKNQSGVSAQATILDAKSGATEWLKTGLLHARAYHTATVLSDGTLSISIIGGIGKDGNMVTAVERFDPSTQRFSETGNHRGAYAGSMRGRAKVAG